MGSILSLELLFWTPTVVDLGLLLFTYGACRWKGPDFIFGWSEEAASKKKTDKRSARRMDQLWELAMVAYSAYACLLPWSVYWCYVQTRATRELLLGHDDAHGVQIGEPAQRFDYHRPSILQESFLDCLLLSHVRIVRHY